jgi:hypothetical protein
MRTSIFGFIGGLIDGFMTIEGVITIVIIGFAKKKICYKYLINT